MSSSRNKGIKAAIRLYQRECAAQHLPLECAIAQLLKHVVNLVEALEDDSHNRVGSAVGAVRYEFRNVRKCFRAEYPDGIDWKDHEQRLGNAGLESCDGSPQRGCERAKR